MVRVGGEVGKVDCIPIQAHYCGERHCNNSF